MLDVTNICFGSVLLNILSSKTPYTAQKMKFSIKDFLNKCGQMADLATFTEEILKGKLHFLCSDITPCYWAIDQLVFSFGAMRSLTCSNKIKSRHSQVLFCQNDHRAFHLFALWKPAWFEKLYQLCMADPQVASTKRLDVFWFCCCSLIRKNVFVRLLSVHKTYNKFLSDLIKQLESFLVVASCLNNFLLWIYTLLL